MAIGYILVVIIILRLIQSRKLLFVGDLKVTKVIAKFRIDFGSNAHHDAA